MLANRLVKCLSVVGLLVSALCVQAADDFNSSRSNRERGTLAAPAPDTGPCKPPYLCDTVATQQDTSAVTRTRTPSPSPTDAASCDASSSSCSVNPPAEAAAKTGDKKNYVGHVTLNK